MTTTISRILVPVDFSGLSAPAREYAIALAKLCGAKLYLIHVIENLIPDEEDLSLLRIDLT
ncbi:MAG: universal stress protein, partial [Candidatus Latescibacteria bacterium]|nr:universal stress protein [Candidatus Latescibacterota bacterium]